MSFVVTAVVAVGGYALYKQDQAQKSANRRAQSAIDAAKEAERRASLEAQTKPDVVANEAAAATRRRRRDNALAYGDTANANDTLGGSSVLGRGAN